MIVLHFLTALGLLVSLVNTFLIWRIHQVHNETVARLTAALLHTVGERQAASAVLPPDETIHKVHPLPQQRARQVGLTGR